MLLGIALHGMLSFMPGIWPVHDTRQSGVYYYAFAALHGFRMPLFFLVSGFFTAMLWRKRGLTALLKHRAKRILLPLILGGFTIIPALTIISALAMSSGAARPEIDIQSGGSLHGDKKAKAADIWSAIANGDTDALNRAIDEGVDVNKKHPSLGYTPLTHAVLHNQPDAVVLLIDKGAEMNAKGQDGGTALHAAAFFGYSRCIELLLENGADTSARNQYGQTPRETMATDWNTTKFIGSLLKIPLVREELELGRTQADQLFLAHADQAGAESKAERGQSSTAGSSHRFDKGKGLIALLMSIPIFHHLWFLWFLCWLVAAFAVYATVAQWRHWKRAPSWLLLSPARFLWLIPLTMIPQWFMGRMIPVFGPDTSVGLLPMPHVLGYYAIFFGFGVLYYDSDDQDGRVGKWWRITLPLTLIIVLPLGLLTMGGEMKFLNKHWQRLVASLFQVFYAWSVSFALMGIFRSLLSKENPKIRYVSDSSYWLYVTHVPLIIAAQWAVRDWPLPSLFKFVLVSVVVSSFLLATYQFMVRYTWIGRMLNGPRQRPHKAPPPIPNEVPA